MSAVALPTLDACTYMCTILRPRGSIQNAARDVLRTDIVPGQGVGHGADPDVLVHELLLPRAVTVEDADDELLAADHPALRLPLVM